jgi:hypothetical protein
MAREILAALLLMILSPSGQLHAQSLRCQTTTANAIELRKFGIAIGTSDKFAEMRAELSIAGVDSSTVRIATVDSICNAVTASINAKLPKPRSTAMVVVSVGNIYISCRTEDLGPHAGVWLLDDHFVVLGILAAT